MTFALTLAGPNVRSQDSKSNVQNPKSQNEPSGPVLDNPTIRGGLNLEPGAAIRCMGPDGKPVTVLRLDSSGTLRLADDPFFWNRGEKDGSRFIEAGNPNSAYPDFRLPITRMGKAGPIDADSKLQLRSLSLIETNDPSEINLLRTGDEGQLPGHDEQPIANGAGTGLIRWMGRRSPGDKPGSGGGYEKDIEICGRNFGTSAKDHYGALCICVQDYRYPTPDQAQVMLVMKPGVRIGDMRESAGEAITGAMFEVDVNDERPVIIRRPEARSGGNVDLVLAAGHGGAQADEKNTLARLRATVAANDPLRAGLDVQTNHGDQLRTDWTLPVPMVEVTRDTPVKIPTGKTVPLAFTKARRDTHGQFDRAAPTKLICRKPGNYVMAACIEFAPEGKGNRQLLVRRNGSQTVAAMRVPAVGGESTQITFSSPPVELANGDVVELLVLQTSGVELELLTPGVYAPVFSMTRVG